MALPPTGELVFGAILAYGFFGCAGCIWAIFRRMDRYGEPGIDPGIVVLLGGFAVFPILNAMLASGVICWLCAHKGKYPHA